MSGVVIATARAGEHGFSKTPVPGVNLLAGLGVEGDAHLGELVKHRSRVKVDPTRPNLRQVHLIHAELLEELAGQGFPLAPGDIGENILTRGIDLLGLPRGALLRLGATAVVEVTGLRNPCSQIDAFRPGLLQHVLVRDVDGTLIRKTGVMGVVRASGPVAPGDAIHVTLPAGPRAGLERV